MKGRNRLAYEQSPYLLQHQNNPVDWYPWSDDAFERAAAEDRPIFLSIGYATCHWCHVMERESFEDESVARILNEHFVSIKVDREERPDVDAIYMDVCEMLSGQGGWPLTIVMTPDRKPFFAATYLPRDSRYGRMGMLELLPRIAAVWKEQREDVLQSAEHLTTTLRRAAEITSESDVLDERTLERGFNQLKRRYDATDGGFGTAPKFPTPHNLLFLLRYWRRTADYTALAMVVYTLDKMVRGGIFDQLGGGFHRYSTDRSWLLPHFEKMLYDQALMATAYAETFQATGSEELRDAAYRVLRYVLRDLTSPEGAFYSAEDADSEGEEGKFYVWSLAEVESVLEPDDAALVARVFGLTEDGNFEDEATRERTGMNVLHVAHTPADVERVTGESAASVRARLEAAMERLFTHRNARVRPALDDKILTDWNGLMIAALAISARTFGEPEFLEKAEQSMAFILEKMRPEEGVLLHRYRAGHAGIPAMADDYAALIWALIELYGSSFRPEYLRHAVTLTDEMDHHFRDAERSGFFLARVDAADLIVRQKEVYDGAIPSANSLHAWNLVRLARLTGRTAYEETAAEVFAFAAPYAAQHASAHTALLMALEHAYSPSMEIVIAGEPDAEGTRAFLEVVRSGYRPNLAVLQHSVESDGVLEELAPFVAGQVPIDGRTAAYFCQDFACQAPTTDPGELQRMLDEVT